MILPELDAAMETEQKNPHHCHTVGAHLIESMRMIEPDKVLRLTMLLHDIGKPVVRSTGEDGVDHFFGHADVSAQMAHAILKRLKFDNDTLYTVEKLIAYHDYRPEISERAVRRFLNKTGKELFPLILKVQRARYCGSERLSACGKRGAAEGSRTSGRKDLRRKPVFFSEGSGG